MAGSAVLPTPTIRTTIDNKSVQAQKGNPMKGHLKLYLGLGILALATGVCLLIAMSFGTVLSAANPPLQGQIAIHPASPSLPPEVAQMQKMQKMQLSLPKPQVRASKQQLEGLIMKQQGGAAKLGMAKAKAVPTEVLRATASLPLEMIERQKMEKQQQSLPKVQSRPTKQQLEALIIKQEGGADLLRNAKAAKPATASQTQAQPLSLDYKVSRPATMNGNNPNYFDLVSSSPSGSVNFLGTTIGFDTPAADCITLLGPGGLSFTLDGTQYVTYMDLQQTISLSGYYIVNADISTKGLGGGTVKFGHYEAGGWKTLFTFALDATSGHQNLPYLGNFAAGQHCFVWVPTGSTPVWVYRVSIEAYQ